VCLGCVSHAGPLKAKLSRNLEAMRREADNLEALRNRGGRAAANGVIRVEAYFENYDGCVVIVRDPSGGATVVYLLSRACATFRWTICANISRLAGRGTMR
jgi:hypothetical protein